MSDLTKEQVEQLQKDLKAAQDKVAEPEKASGGNADAAKARTKIDALEKTNKELSDQVAGFQKEKEDAEKAKLTEVERLKKEKEEADGKAKSAEEALAKTLRENAFGFAAMAAGCTNIPDAIKLADLSGFKADDPEASKAFVEEFKKSKPYLFGEVKNAQVGTTGHEARPGDDKKDQETKLKLEEAAKKGDSLAALNALTPAKKS